MKPEQYEAWYATQRGAWIGGEEYRLLDSLLAQTLGETLLDVGCGTDLPSVFRLPTGGGHATCFCFG